MPRLRQYEIDIIMNKLSKLVEDYNDDILTQQEVEAKAIIKLYAELPELEELNVLEKESTELASKIQDIKTKIKEEAARLEFSTSKYFNFTTYKRAAEALIKKEAGFKSLDYAEATYQIMNSDNNNLESIMNKMKEMFLP